MMRSLTVPIYLLLALWSQASTLHAAPPPPHGPVPTERQLRWHEMEFYGFIHFTVNTFTDKEWGYGDESEQVFNPTALDANQWARTAKLAGMKGLILTAKHHDGFCLWPSKFTEHSVKNSPWKQGQGDVVKELAEACQREGLRFGVYLSPWDRNYKDYGRSEYLTYYRNQLRELLTQYGDIFTVWFDGANGGDGFYGGAREKRQIDNKTYYEWPVTRKLVRDLMPMAVMFSDVGPDFRWVGNEKGIAGETCWATLNPGQGVPGNTRANLNQGERPGTDWIPPECDVSIRPGWFYHAAEDSRVKTPAQLLDIYYKSVGRAACLNLNLPPDRRGLIHDNDIKSLREFRRILDETFAHDLARDGKISASNARGQAPAFAAENLTDGKPDTYWATDDAVTNAEVTLAWPKPVTFNVVSLREYLPLGQRIEAFALDAWQNGAWKEFAHGTSIGHRRLVRGSFVTTEKLRLRVVQAAVCPALAEFAAYAEPVIQTAPLITRDKTGAVTITAPSAGPVIHYTLDGSEPLPVSAAYEQPFPLLKGGTVKARAFGPSGQTMSDTATEIFGLAKTKWKIIKAPASVKGAEATRLIDERPETCWHTQGPEADQPPPQEIVIDLGETLTLTGFTCLPRQDGSARGLVDRYACYAGTNSKEWGAPVAQGEFANIQANPIQQTVRFSAPVRARYLRFVALHVVEGAHVALAEIGVLGN